MLVSPSKYIIIELILVIDGWGIAPRWWPMALADNKSAFVQVMDWYREETNHQLSWSWPNPKLPYGVTRPQWLIQLGLKYGWHNGVTKPQCFNALRPRQNGRLFADGSLNAFYWTKMYGFRLTFHWILFLTFKLTGADNGLAPTRRQAITWANDG